MKRYWWPLAIFVVVVGFLAIGLRLNPRELPSPLVGKPAPAFDLPTLHAADQRVSTADLRGKVWLLNVWASWCTACLVEHPVLVDLARQGTVPLYGLNYKDKGANAMRWLQQHGNPYVVSVVDADGVVGIDWGVYGVPETFVIDKQGVIRHKHVGPVTPDALRETILPLVRALDAG